MDNAKLGNHTEIIEITDGKTYWKLLKMAHFQ